MEYLIDKLAQEFNIRPKQVQDTVELIDAGNTIPFIARYRKEVTGNLSDVLLRDLDARLTYLRKLQKRKEEIAGSIEEQGKLTPELAAAIDKAATLQEAEDLYLPYKQKKKTRASMAKEKGLEPLANKIYLQLDTEADLAEDAKNYINPEKGVETAEDALQGAMDIIAETISDNADYRKKIRRMVTEKGAVKSTVTKVFAEEKTEFENYYDYGEPVKKIANHRVLALNRGEKRKVLAVKIVDPAEDILAYLKKSILRDKASGYLVSAIEDSYKRLIFPSIEREIRTELKEKAEESAIKMFALNLKKLLLQPPFKDKTTMGFDPAFRTGCKIAVLDPMGKLLDTATVYPTEPKNEVAKSEKILLGMIEKYKVDIISIGNGTASRESEQFVAEMLKKTDRPVQYIVVNEAGASVYSASELGAEEYPDINVSLRGAISIAGRLQDPLSDLVKIDPKHIGVGQYQHDVNQKELEKVLDDTVEDAVNNVGVNINRASVSLLKHVAGVNKTIAKNIIDYREQNGKFGSRKEIKKVKGLGAKAFEQCAGFLRIDDGDNILDNTGVHPESYKAVQNLLKSMGLTTADLEADKLADTVTRLNALDVKATASMLEIGEPTLRDIIKELKKPGRDPRDAAPKPHLKSDVLSIEDLKPDMELVGTVRNVIDFGAFVDIGVHQDGLVHISQISDRYISHPTDVLSVGDVVTVKVLSVDVERKRIGLSMLI
ncbi:Tex family protein [Eubacterium limosum]|uniref:Tex family protein n=1 Tax=Eubacterium limosum TaxID=1736 RepID=UPI0010640846|nr:Tex family protein [Eubacterium limosum]